MFVSQSFCFMFHSNCSRCAAPAARPSSSRAQPSATSRRARGTQRPQGSSTSDPGKSRTARQCPNLLFWSVAVPVSANFLTPRSASSCRASGCRHKARLGSHFRFIVPHAEALGRTQRRQTQFTMASLPSARVPKQKRSSQKFEVFL
jgi:hypothetical protein